MKIPAQYAKAIAALAGQALGPLDTAAHFLYCPGMFGRRIAVARWYHRIHLIPSRLLKPICDRYDRSLMAEFDHDEGFYEDDEPAEKVKAAFADGEKGVTAPPARICGWSCEHVSITAGPYMTLGRPSTSYCGCEMQPIYA